MLLRKKWEVCTTVHDFVNIEWAGLVVVSITDSETTNKRSDFRL